jgi:hypothetical protein
MSTIAIEVDEETAKAYQAATEEQRRKVQLLLRLRIRDIFTSPKRSLQQVMDDIGREAKAAGLTPEILESILRDE